MLSHFEYAQRGAAVSTVRDIRPRLLAARRVHLVGIGGSGMQALASVLWERGYRVTGSDLDPDAAWAVAAQGVPVHAGHNGRFLATACDALIYSDAVSAENPERRAATARGVPQYSYPRALGELVRAQPSLAVTGSHGKSTTVAMLGEILANAGAEPTVILGGRPRGQTTGGCNGRGRLLIAEACEYRRNFLHLQPERALVLGIDHDHFDAFSDAKQYRLAFADFLKNIPNGGRIYLSEQAAAQLLAVQSAPRATSLDRRTQRATSVLQSALGLSAEVQLIGTAGGCRWQAKDVSISAEGSSFRLVQSSGDAVDPRPFKVRLPGRHNLYNALAAAAVAADLGCPADSIRRGLARFDGLHRRLERRHVAKRHSDRGLLDFPRYDDYAHHPTEVAATVATVRLLHPEKRLVCVFQPHQVSRLKARRVEFARSLAGADAVVVTEVCCARESADGTAEVLARKLVRDIRQLGRTGVFASRPAALDAALRYLDREAVLVTMGAGDIGKLHDELDRRI